MGRNSVGKGEIAHYEQFLLYPQCFQKTCTAQGLFGKRLIPHKPEFHNPEKKPIETIVEKGESAGNQHFLLFTLYFLLILIQIGSFFVYIIKYCRKVSHFIWKKVIGNLEKNNQIFFFSHTFYMPEGSYYVIPSVRPFVQSLAISCVRNSSYSFHRNYLKLATMNLLDV